MYFLYDYKFTKKKPKKQTDVHTSLQFMYTCSDLNLLLSHLHLLINHLSLRRFCHFPPRNVVISFYHDVTKNQTNPSTPTAYTLVHTSILSISFKLRSRVTPFKTFSETEWRPPRLFSSKHITARHYAAEEGHLSSQLTQINGPHPFPRPDFQ